MNARAKGLAFEREVAAAFTAAGFAVRGLEAGGDHFVVQADGAAIHVECKRQERPRLELWLRQQERDCPPGVLPLLVWRKNRAPAYAVLPLEQVIPLLARPGRGA